MLLNLSLSRFLPLFLLTLVSLLGIFLSEQSVPELALDPRLLSAGDTAWMLTATALVLLMTH
jgi:hypothetical protein